MSWSKDGGTLPNRALDQNGVLLIPNVGVEDAGTYICTGSSPFRVESDTATLTVGGTDGVVKMLLEVRKI